MRGLGLLRGLGPLGLMGPLRGLGPLGGLRLLAGLAALALVAACSEAPEVSEVPEAPQSSQSPIAFSGALASEEAVTRAETPLSAYVQNFRIYGFKNMSHDATAGYGDLQQVFPGYRVLWTENSANSTITNTHGWEYVNRQALGEEEQTVKYWDWSATAYRFFAIAGISGTNEVTGTYKTYDGGTDGEYQAYDVAYQADADYPAAIPYYSHLWFQPTDSRQFGQPVQLEFLKPFATVRFMFTFEDPAVAKTTELTDKKFRPTNDNTIKKKGNVIVSYPLTGNNVTETFSTHAEAEGMTALTQDYYAAVSKENGTVVEPYLNADASATGKEYTLLPATAQGSYTMTVLVNGQPKNAVVPAEFMDWKPGFKYTYIFKVHVDGSVGIDIVQSAFTPWTDHQATHTVYNW